MKEKWKKLAIILLLILSLIIIDQVIKSIIPKEETNIIDGFLKFTYTENTGAAFGFASGNLGAIIITNAIVLGIAARFLIAQFDKTDKQTKIALCCILAGGISNLIDRIVRGYVLDYINLNYIFPLSIFNLADILVVFGWIALVIFTIKISFKKQKLEE